MLKQIIQHKFITGTILLLIIIGGYFGYKNIANDEDTVRYVTAAVKKGTLIVSTDGSGQVSVSDQVDIKPKVSGDIINVRIKNGQEVKAGELIIQLDTRNAQKAVRDAEVNLENAKLALVKLKKPADALSILEVKNALTKAKSDLPTLKLNQKISYQKTLEAKTKAEDNITKAYEDGFNTVANAFLDLPTIMAGLEDVLYDYDINSNQWNINAYMDLAKGYDEKVLRYKDDAADDYQTARAKYKQSFPKYQSASRYSDTTTVEALINETYAATKDIAEAVKSAKNLIDSVKDILAQRDLAAPSITATHQSSLKTYVSDTNGHLINLLAVQRTIRDNKETKLNAKRDLEKMDQNNPLDLAAAERLIKEKTESLIKLKADPDPLDIQSQEIAIKQRVNALLDAKEKLADYYIYAPFDGIITKTAVKKGDTVSSSTVAAVLITKQKLAEISLNEIDIVKVKTGQKTTITFDAIEDLSITGEVVEIDTLSEVNQGIVTYNIKIAFDTQDQRIKPGMSISLAIITDVRQNVLIAPNSAIKSDRESGQYVEILENDIPRRQPVEVGLSNDLSTEIINGLKEGDSIVTQTINPGSTINQSRQNSGLRIPGLGGSRGGGFRGGGGSLPH